VLKYFTAFTDVIDGLREGERGGVEIAAGNKKGKRVR